MSSLRRERRRAAERREERGEGALSVWELPFSRPQSYFKRLTTDMEKAEMRPLMWNDMPDDRERGRERERPL